MRNNPISMHCPQRFTHKSLKRNKANVVFDMSDFNWLDEDFDLSEVENLDTTDEVEDAHSNETVYLVDMQHHSVTSNERTLLQCANLQVSTTSKRNTQSVPVFLDSGSNQTFISRKLASQLQLPLTNPRKSSVLLFGKNKTDVKLHSTVFRMSLGNGMAVAVKAEVIDGLTAPLAIADPDKITETLKNSKKPLTIKRVEPEVLLGMDYLKCLRVTPERDLDNGFCVFTSTAGLIVAGKGVVANPGVVKIQSNACFYASITPRKQHKNFTETHKKQVSAPRQVELASDARVSANRVVHHKDVETDDR